METGLQSMTKKEKTSSIASATTAYHKLSIQVSLNGLSFCILDTITDRIVNTKSIVFEAELTPHQLEKELISMFSEHQLTSYNYADVVVLHDNNLFSLVPKALFSADETSHYLKYNTKILANDFVTFDTIESYDLVNVFVPFVNINNYILEQFGPFEYVHSGTIRIESLLNLHSSKKDTICYVHVNQQQMDITILTDKKLKLYNSFQYYSTTDFIYYILFAFEQLKLDPETVRLKLFGNITEEDEIYKSCFEYIKHVSIFAPITGSFHLDTLAGETIDFTLINAI